MKKKDTGKKAWIKPSIQVLRITRDTFGGSGGGPEGAGKKGPPGGPG